jgi:hypothetical protein
MPAAHTPRVASVSLGELHEDSTRLPRENRFYEGAETKLEKGSMSNVEAFHYNCSNGDVNNESN